MKKVLALVLAVMMMATVAFAASIGGEMDQDFSTNGVNPGDSIVIYPEAFQNNDGVKLSDELPSRGYFSSENFTVNTKRFEKGSTMVKAVEFDDDDNVLKIKLNDYFDMKRTDNVNLILREIKITAKRTLEKDNKKVSKNSKWTCDVDSAADCANNSGVAFRVGYQVLEVPIEDDFELRVTKDSGAVYEDGIAPLALDTATGSGNLVKFVAGDAYGTVNLDFEDVAYATGRVYKNDLVFLKFNQDVDTDIVKKYPDADLTFVNFKGAPTFNSNMELEIYADEDMYIYEVKDKKVAPCNLKWDEDSYAFTGKVRTLGAYVISDTKLNIETAAADGNPDTGANDVVGIATALAAVALVSAAAVSLKK